MEKIEFYKMSGSGNDFIIIDNRRKMVDETDLTHFIIKICRRKMSVGADGFILVEDSEAADFKWRFYNSDGSTAEMCGNGARCVARFAYLNGISGTDMSFETQAGIVQARVSGERVKIKMTDPSGFKADYMLDLKGSSISVSSINTGVPHVVIVTEGIENAEVVKVGREIRHHPLFAPDGTNVNFLCPVRDNTIAIRTYERGVEDETLACGTGSVAGALIMAHRMNLHSPIQVLTRSGGYLNVFYEEEEGQYTNIFLEGDARVIYTAHLCEDAWK